MIKAFRLAINNLFSNPARTGLTTLGIIIGIATVILVLSAGEGFRSLINDQVGALGSNTLFIQTKVPPTTKNRASSTAGGGGSGFSAVAITTFKQRDLDDIKKLGNVVGDYGMVTGLGVASYRNNEKSVIYYGASADRFSIDQHTLKAGRFYNSTEEIGSAQVVILGSNIASDLFDQDDPIGKLIRVGNLNFLVVGIYNPQGFAGGGTADDSIYMPLSTAQKKMLGIDYLTIGVVQVKNIDLGDATAEDIKAVIRHNHDITDFSKDDFSVQTQAQALDSFNTIFNGVTILLICISAISLLVGGVGIMNIMYVVVTERTSEIGLKKALGATNSDILSEFLMEAVLVTIIGGVVGIILGSFLGWAVSVIATATGLVWAFSVPTYAIFLAVGVSAVIGIGFGVLPARDAAKLDPITALQYE